MRFECNADIKWIKIEALLNLEMLKKDEKLPAL